MKRSKRSNLQRKRKEANEHICFVLRVQISITNLSGYNAFALFGSSTINVNLALSSKK